MYIHPIGMNNPGKLDHQFKRISFKMTGKKIIIRPGRQKFDRVGTKDQKIPDITLVFDLCPGRAGILFVPVPQLMSTHPVGWLDLNICQFLWKNRFFCLSSTFSVEPRILRTGNLFYPLPGF